MREEEDANNADIKKSKSSGKKASVSKKSKKKSTKKKMRLDVPTTDVLQQILCLENEIRSMREEMLAIKENGKEPTGDRDETGTAATDNNEDDDDDEETGSTYEIGEIVSDRANRCCGGGVGCFGDDRKHLLFADSTHSFLFLDEVHLEDDERVKVLLRDRLLAVLVVVFQLASYGLFLYLMLGEEAIVSNGMDSHGMRAVQLDYEYCEQLSGNERSIDGASYQNLAEAGVTTEMLPRLLQCGDPPDANLSYLNAQNGTLDIVVIVFAVLLLLSLLLPDIIGSFLLLGCPGLRVKIVAAVLLCKSVVAIIVGMASITMTFSIGLFNVFLLCVGVICISEVDEKHALGWRLAASFYRAEGRSSKCCNLNLFAKWVCFVFFGVAAYIGFACIFLFSNRQNLH